MTDTNPRTVASPITTHVSHGNDVDDMTCWLTSWLYYTTATTTIVIDNHTIFAETIDKQKHMSATAAAATTSSAGQSDTLDDNSIVIEFNTNDGTNNSGNTAESSHQQQQQKQQQQSVVKVHRIISLDGGGVRGIITLYFLRLMQKALQLRDPEFQLHRGNRNVQQWAGTSIGGIIATAVGVCGCNVDQLAERHVNTETLKSVFDKSLWDRMVGAVQWRPKYDGRGKTKWLQQLMTDDTPFQQPTNRYGDPTPLVMIPVLQINDTTAPQVQFFVNHCCMPSAMQHVKCPAWQVADATSAAPVYFPPVRIQPFAQSLGQCIALQTSQQQCIETGMRLLHSMTTNTATAAAAAQKHNGDDDDKRHQPTSGCGGAETSGMVCLDGGLGINNPIAAAIALAVRSCPPGTHIKAMSIGTGRTVVPLHTQDTSNWGSLQWLMKGNLLSMILDGSAMNEVAEYMLPDEGDLLYINSVLASTAADDDRDVEISGDIDDTSPANVEAMKQLAHCWWRQHCRHVFAFFDMDFVAGAENVCVD